MNNFININSLLRHGRKILVAFVGLSLLGLGVALMRVINLGVDPFGAMNLGFSQVTGISFGTFIWISHSPIFVIMLWRARRLIGIGTLMGMFIVGYVIDFFYYFANLIPFSIMDTHLVVRLLLLVPAMLIFSFGIALYMIADVGTVPFDAAGVIIEEATKGKFKFRWARIMMDGICAVIAFALGAPLGVATILTVVCLGPLISYFISLFRVRTKPKEATK